LLVRHTTRLDMWELPGGRLHIDEDPRIGLQREIREELGVSIEVGEVISVEEFTMKRTGEQHVALIFIAKLLEDDSFVVDADEVAEVVWVTKENWRNYHLFGNYERALEHYFSRI